jgi:DNA-binding MarR family transcriptional regulator
VKTNVPLIIFILLVDIATISGYNIVDSATIYRRILMKKLYHKPRQFGHWASVLHRMRNVYFEHELKPYGIGHGQDRILSMLHHLTVEKEYKEVKQVDLSRILYLDKATVTRSIKKLEKKGFITRTRSEKDSREYLIALTDKALAFINTLKGIRKAWTGIIGKGFSAEEKKMALSMLEKMAGNAHDFLHEYRKRRIKDKE